MTPQAVLGIDPGNSGAAVLISHDRLIMKEYRFKNRRVATFWEMTELAMHYNLQALVEKVHGIRGDAMGDVFAFGANYGYARDLVELNNIPYERILPLDWQLYFKLGKIPKKDKKRKHTERARELFPDRHIIQDTGDAWLIAEYAWRLWCNGRELERNYLHG